MLFTWPACSRTRHDGHSLPGRKPVRPRVEKDLALIIATRARARRALCVGDAWDPAQSSLGSVIVVRISRAGGIGGMGEDEGGPDWRGHRRVGPADGFPDDFVEEQIVRRIFHREVEIF